MKTPILIFLLLLLSAAGSALLLAQEASGPQGQGAGWPYMEERGAVDISGLESYLAPEAAPSFQLPTGQNQPVQAEAGSPVLDKALGLVGLPGMSAALGDESTYEKAWHMQDGPNGTTRLTYGERYRRNPDGSYGAQSSSQWSGVNNVADRLLEQALSAGSGYFSSWAEGWLGGFGKARISVRVNDEGDVTGSGDFLYPIYDSERTTFFTQIGLRTMANDRVIGNFGLGQRFFPAEKVAFGYNFFIDQDFSRNHTRGGAGVEAWFDWVRLAANYYTPLSGWKCSKDYDHRLVEERPAEGFDARLTGYLPFYRNLAVTGAFEQWKGEHVGSFGSDDVVQRDPKVWSYGLEWTPIPAFSTSVNQRHSGSKKETQFALTFNYNFGMDWEDQLSSATVTEMRTVDGSRHDFVNRQNEIILEYRRKGGVADDIGPLLVTGLNILICDAGGNNCRAFVSGNYTSPNFDKESSGYFSLVNLKVVDIPEGCTSLTCANDLSGGTINWAITNVGNPTDDFYWPHGTGNAINGLSWGVTPLQLSGAEQAADNNTDNIPGSSGGSETVSLTDIVGSRSITIEVTVNGVTESAVFAFGKGPLSVFGKYSAGQKWANVDDITAATDYPAADTFCGGKVNGNNSAPTPWPPSVNSNWSDQIDGFYYYAIGSKLPTAKELQAVSGHDGSYNVSGRGAALAAGWPAGGYWTGEVGDYGDNARIVYLDDGLAGQVVSLVSSSPVVCRP